LADIFKHIVDSLNNKRLCNTLYQKQLIDLFFLFFRIVVSNVILAAKSGKCRLIVKNLINILNRNREISNYNLYQFLIERHSRQREKRQNLM